jgi:TPR repeat protein
MKGLTRFLLFAIMTMGGLAEDKKLEPYSVELVKGAEAFVKESIYPDQDKESKYREVYLINKENNGETHELTVKALWLLSECQIHLANNSIEKPEKFQRLISEAKENAETLIKITKGMPSYEKEYQSAMHVLADVQILNHQYEDAILTLSELTNRPNLANDITIPKKKTLALVKLCSLYAITGNMDKEREAEHKISMPARIKEVKYIPEGVCQIGEKWGENVKDLFKFDKRDIALEKICRESGGKEAFQIRGAIKQVILCKRPNKEPIFLLLCRTLRPYGENSSSEGGPLYMVDSTGKIIPSSRNSITSESLVGDVLKTGYAQIVFVNYASFRLDWGNKTNPKDVQCVEIDLVQVDDDMPLVLMAVDFKPRRLVIKNDDTSEYPKIFCYENEKAAFSIFYNSIENRWQATDSSIYLCNNPQWRSPGHKTCPSRYQETSSEGLFNFMWRPYAMEFSEIKAESGDIKDQYLLGSYYSSTINGVRKDVNKGKEWLELAAEKGHARAQYELGMLCMEGSATTKSEEEAMKWFLKSSMQNVGDAQVNLTQIFGNGQGEAKFDKEVYKQAFAWLLSQAELGNSEMQFAVAMSYYNGNSLTKNANEGLKWMTVAAENGNNGAATMLGQFYLAGNMGALKDDKTALRWFVKGAEAGNAVAQNFVGDCYLDGKGTDADPKEAVKWYCKGAKTGFPSSTLGDCYLNGIGVIKDEKEAVKCYTKSASLGDTWAEYMIGKCLRDGVGTTKNEAESQFWFSKANEGGKRVIEWSRNRPEQLDVDTQYFLGQIYIYGIGAEKNKEEAGKWFAKAAENGNQRAQIALEALQSEKR